jgi:hypothetical protein
MASDGKPSPHLRILLFGSRRARSTLLPVSQRTSKNVTLRHRSKCGHSPECAPSRPHLNLGIPCCVLLLRYGRKRKYAPAEQFFGGPPRNHGSKVSLPNWATSSVGFLWHWGSLWHSLAIRNSANPRSLDVEVPTVNQFTQVCFQKTTSIPAWYDPIASTHTEEWHSPGSRCMLVLSVSRGLVLSVTLFAIGINKFTSTIHRPSRALQIPNSFSLWTTIPPNHQPIVTVESGERFKIIGSRRTHTAISADSGCIPLPQPFYGQQTSAICKDY